MNLTKATIRQTRTRDVIDVGTSLPVPLGLTSKRYVIHITVERGTGVEYVQKHMPNLPIEVIGEHKVKPIKKKKPKKSKFSKLQRMLK